MTFAQRKFGEIAEFRNGINYVAGDQGETAKVVGVGDFQNKTELTDFNFLKEVRIRGTVSVDDELRDGDLLFVRSNGNKNLIGRCVVIRTPPRRITFSGFTIRARVDKTIVLPDYVSLIFRESQTKRQMAVAGGGNGNISNLSQSILASLQVHLPDLVTQQSLVDTAILWTAAIERTERLIAAKERRFTALTLKLLHSNADSWHPLHLRDICSPVTRKNAVGEVNVLTTSAQHGLVSQLDYYKKSVSAEDLSGYYLLKPGEFAYNRSSANGYPYGAIKRLEGNRQGVLSTLYLCFSLKPDVHCDSDFLDHVFEAGVLNRQLASVCQEGARSHGLLNITKADFFGLKIEMPPLMEQQRIASVLTTARREIAVLKQQADAFRRQKRGLMQKLLTGEWRVRGEKELLA